MVTKISALRYARFWKGETSMKKLVSVLCTLSLALSMFSVPVFASSTEKVPNFEVMNAEGESNVEFVTRANPRDLYYEENHFLVNQDVQRIVVTPTKGRKLRMWIKTDNPVNVDCEYTNVFGLWHGFYDQDLSGEQDVLITSSCDGKPYRISIRTSAWATYSILLYETD